jgi:hypothetical protein
MAAGLVVEARAGVIGEDNVVRDSDQWPERLADVLASIATLWRPLEAFGGL